jgi:hypothetical protein
MNPFRFSEPVGPDDLIDRDEEAATLLRRAGDGDNSRLVAPRRYGKTSLIRRVHRTALDDGWATVYVDFFGVLTIGDVAERIERAYASQLRGKLATWFEGLRRSTRSTVRVGGGPVPASVEAQFGPSGERPLLDALSLPVRMFERHGVRTLVAFDEFQDVLTAKQGVDAVMRSEIQHHGEAASYVFAGSHVGMMRELFADKRRAFYGQAGPVELSPLRADDVAAFVDARFSDTGRAVGTALGPLLDLCQGHPQRTMLMANALWDATGPKGRASEETFTAAYGVVRRLLRDELRALWTGLTAGQRRVLAAIAANRSPLYAAAREYGGSRGGAVSGAVTALVDRGEVVVDRTTTTGYRLVDPLLADWVDDGRPDD